MGQLAKVRTPRILNDWADILRKRATTNIALHSVLTQKSEINLNF